MSSEKPHIILFMTDQHRADAVGCFGNSIIKTPNIDSLAEEGVVFTKAYTSTPSCTPARAGLLTGMAPWNHGMLGYAYVAEHYKYELPRMLRENGYYTIGIGKMHWRPQRALHGFHQTLLDESGRVEDTNFISDYRAWFKKVAPDQNPDATGLRWNENKAKDYALDEKLHPTHWTGSTAVKFLQDYQKSEPLFLKVSFARPHSPYDAPKRFVDLYNVEDMPSPIIGKWTDFFKNFEHIVDPYFGDFGEDFAKRARCHYYANITFIDEQIGYIIKILKEKGMYDNSLIVFTADHGDMLGDHYHWRKTYAYEGSSRIPMVLKLPSSIKLAKSRGVEVAHPVELRDILPTFLDSSGVKKPIDMDGDSLLKLLDGRESEWREYIDLEHATCYHWTNYWMALTDGKIKYIYFRSTGSEQLFDLEQDPDEINDLSQVKEYQDVLNLWRERMIKHLKPRGRKWVKNGQLRKTKRRLMFSPNYPKKKLKK